MEYTVNKIKKKKQSFFSDDNVGNHIISIYDIKYKRISTIYILLNLNRTIDFLKKNQLIIFVYRSENCLTTFSSVYH